MLYQRFTIAFLWMATACFSVGLLAQEQSSEQAASADDSLQQSEQDGISATASTLLYGYHPSLPAIESPEVVWSFVSEKELDDGTKRSVGLSSPQCIDGVVYIGNDDGALRAFKSVDGELLWTYEAGSRIYTQPICDGENVYVTTQSGIDAVACAGGELVWQKRFEEEERSIGECVVWPIRAPGERKATTIYYGTSTGELRALDTRRGLEKWESSLMENVPEDPEGFDGANARMGDAPCRPNGINTDGSVVIVSMFDQSRIIAFGASSGIEYWSFPTFGWTRPAATIAGEHVVAGGQSGKLFCVSLESGEQEWMFDGGSRISSTASVVDDHVFIPFCDGRLYCLELASGDVVWEYAPERAAVYCQPLVTTDSVYYGTGDGFLHCVNRETGDVRWKLHLHEGSNLYSELTTDGERIFIQLRPSGDGEGEDVLVAVGIAER